MTTFDPYADIADYADYWQRLRASHALHPGNRFRYWLIARQLQRAGVRFSTVLDCGCGDGSLLALMRDRFSPERTCGIDINSRNVELLRSLDPRSEFHCADLGAALEKPPWPAAELVLCCEVIEHIREDDVAIRNLAKLVAPGGHLVLTTQSGKIRRTERFLGHLRHYQPEDLRKRLEGVGFDILECTVWGWPLLDFQKILAERFFGQVQQHVISARRPSRIVRAAFFALFHGYKMCAFGRGPQIFILARGRVDAGSTRAAAAGGAPRLSVGAADSEPRAPRSADPCGQP